MEVLNQLVEKANILIEAVPYIKRFRGREVLIKYGGAAMLDPEVRKNVLHDLVFMNMVGIRPILIHGGGPNRRAREAGFFNLQLIGELHDDTLIRARVTGDRDPGYGSTCKMLSESAVCLAQNELEIAGGFWTPASAFGERLLPRLIDNAGLTFELE